VGAEILGDEEFRIDLGAARDGEAWAFERLFHLVAQPLVGYFHARQDRIPPGHGGVAPGQQQVAGT